MKILIVDDSTFMRTILKNIIAGDPSLQAEIIEAADGEEAVKRYNEEKPDLVLLDIIMPKKDGLSVLSDIGMTATIVIVSAVGQEKVIQDAKTAGAKDFITKPFEASKILETIKKVAQG